MPFVLLRTMAYSPGGGEEVKWKTIVAVLIALLLVVSTVGGILADELTKDEKTEEMTKIEKALAEDGISSTDWEKGKYECWHIARDVQVGLWDNESFDTALDRVKFKKKSFFLIIRKFRDSLL